MRMRTRSIAAVLGAVAAGMVAAACADDPGALAPTGRNGRPSLATAADGLPGTDVNHVGPSKVLLGSLAPAAYETGKISVSVDAKGADVFPTTIRVMKPAGATVRKVFVASASTGFSGYMIPNGAIQIAGVPISWNITTPSSISSYNHWADATAALSGAMNALLPGPNAVPYLENPPYPRSPYDIDGSILIVVWDVPTQPTDQTLVVMFGAQSITGDNFYVNLTQPIGNVTTLTMDMGLGISFGYQPAGQYSHVDVNGQELTNCAGGQDDGYGNNGGLITVGGIGDLNDNPPLHCTEAIGPRADDELYSLVPFVHTGESQVHVYSINPSNDDNIFLAYFLMNVAGNVTPTPDGVPPSCKLTNTGTDGSGQKYIEITVQDTKSGLMSINVMQSTNANTVVPPFPPLTTDPVVVRATKINQSSGSQVELKATDGAGNVTTCDPADVTLKIDKAAREAHATIKKIGASEHFVEVSNETPGVRSVSVKVNGREFTVDNLASGEHRTLDIASAMHGKNNAINLSARGPANSSAWVLIHD